MQSMIKCRGNNKGAWLGRLGMAHLNIFDSRAPGPMMPSQTPKDVSFESRELGHSTISKIAEALDTYYIWCDSSMCSFSPRGSPADDKCRVSK